jgi:Protein of unknown function (DUF1553)/Protein of unknown function (DUF1549)/Planctomycete cytochrome C
MIRLTVLLITLNAVSAAADDISFATEIRPILSDRCFRCHGPDESQRQTDLRLDEEASARSLLDSEVRAIVPGDISASELIARITTEDPDLIMPPSDSGKSLSQVEIDRLTEWVRSGAQWGVHWAFEPVVRPAVPEKAETTGAIQNGIDSFVGRKLSDIGLLPNAEADRVSLIRRVTLDLSGLPPTSGEVEDFLADGSPNAYSKVVNRLLNSPHFGEHMARHWLDAARYGDTHGLHLDNFREMWAYRDWVINALNANMPFDQFTTEQLAGDLLENPTDDQLIATGFNRCHVTTNEGGSIADEVEVRNTVDRVVTTGTVFLGLTLDCTRCHDHKFDPLTMRDFYSLYAFFNSIDGGPMDGNRKDHAPVINVFTEGQRKRLTELTARENVLQDQINGIVAGADFQEPDVPTEPVFTDPVEFVWIDDAVPAGAKAAGDSAWKFVKAPLPVLSGNASHTRKAKGRSQHYFTGAKQPLRIAEGDVLFCNVWIDKANPAQEIMLQWNDGTWEHRAYWGTNKIDWGKNETPSRQHLGDLPQSGEWVRLEIPVARVGLSPGKEVNGWAFTQFGGTVYWDSAGIVSKSSQQPVYDSFALWLRDQRKSGGSTLPEQLRTALNAKPEDESKENDNALRLWFLEHAWTETRDSIASIESELQKVETERSSLEKNGGTTQIFRELRAAKPAHILNRGEYDDPKEEVPRAVPSVLSALPNDAPLNRLGLAMWLTDDAQPLTSRVTVNRIWQQFFGTGLVKTSEDFGSQGEPPSHRELLDWLSSEFMHPQISGSQHRWDVKHIVRLIVTSAAYRRSAHATKTSLQRDPENRLLSRGPRFRLDAETLRDQALFVGGLLVDRIGGPSVKPPQPDGLWFAVGYSGSNTVRFKKDDGHDKVHRRSMYTFLKRTAPAPQMSTFDAPSRESCVVRRERTNSPLQALLLLNDPQYVECARGLAERTLKECDGPPAERVAWMLRQAVQRTPVDSEVLGFVQDYEAFHAEFEADPNGAAQLISIGEMPPGVDVDSVELAAWTLVANTMLNLDEFLNK